MSSGIPFSMIVLIVLVLVIITGHAEVLGQIFDALAAAIDNARQS